jgi:hypothetical protein
MVNSPFRMQLRRHTINLQNLGFLIRHPKSSCSHMLVKGTPVICNMVPRKLLLVLLLMFSLHPSQSDQRLRKQRKLLRDRSVNPSQLIG